MIEVELPDGRVLEIDAPDEAAAARAAKMFMDKERGAAEPQQPDLVAGGRLAANGSIIPVPGGSDTPAPTSGVPADPVRALKLGTQGAGRGIADLAGAPVDVTTALINAGIWAKNQVSRVVRPFVGPLVSPADTPLITNPAGGSQSLSDAASGVMAAASVDPIEERDMSVGERLAYNINRMGTQAVAGSGLGTLGAAARTASGASAAPRMIDPLVKPYAGNATRAAIGDVAAGAGSGVGVTIANEVAPDSPLAQVAGALVGGIGGSTLAQARAVPSKLAAAVKSRMTAELPYDPEAPPLSRTTNSIADQAADALRQAARDKGMSADTIAAQRTAFENEGLPTPTTGLLTNDIGLTSVEKQARQRNPVPFIERDRELQGAAQREVESTRPAGVPQGDANRGAQRFGEQRVAELRTQGQANVSAAERRLSTARQRLETLQQDEATASAPIAQQRGDARAADASRGIDRTVTGELETRTAEKNARFDAIDPQRLVQRDAADIIATVREIRANVGTLSPEASGLPREFIQRIEAIAPNMVERPSGVLGPDGRPLTRNVNEGGPGTVAIGDLVDVRKYLTTAADKAQQAGNFDLANNVRTLRRQINEEIDRFAFEPGNEGSVAAGAQSYYREEYAPFFANGPGREFRDRVQRDSTGRTKLPPSEVGAFWLHNTEENAVHLARIMDASQSRAEGLQAVRNFMVSDLARTVGQDGRVNLPLVSKWIENNANVLRQFPAVEREVHAFRQNVTNAQAGQNAMRSDIERLAAGVRSAREGTATTERAINDGMLGVLINNSPENAVRAVFSAGDPSRAMREMGALLNSAPANIRQGLKDSWGAAVADHLAAKVRNTHDAVSYAKLVREVRSNEAVYAVAFGPAEMNALRRAQKALEPLGDLSIQATRGSPTAENLRVWNTIEAGLKAYYGVLKGGGVLRTLRVTAKALGPDDSPFVARLVERALLDPRIAEALFARNLAEAGTPAWNAKLNRALGYSEGVRAAVSYEQNDNDGR